MIAIQVKIGVLFIAAACGTATASWRQQVTQKPSVAVLVTRLQSQSKVERSEAFEELRSNPAALKSPEVRAALLDLPDRENRERGAKLLQAQNSPQADKGEVEDEGSAEYYSQILGAVDSFADWNDARQACILVDASYNDDSAFAAEIADHVTVALPCLMKKSENAISLERTVTVPVLLKVLGKANGALDPTTALAARQIVLGALQDPDEAVRAFTVNALGTYGGKDMVTALRKVVATDPSPEVDGSSIRKAAADAIAAIQKRAVATPPTVTPH